jgi:tight adherence protein B
VTGETAAVAFVGIAGAGAALSILGLARAASRAYTNHVNRTTAVGLHQQFIELSSRQMLLIAVTFAVLVGLLGLALLPLPIAAALGATALFIPRLALQIVRSQRQSAITQQMPEAIEALAGSLRGGANLHRGLELLATHQPRPIRDEFALMVTRRTLGGDLNAALSEFCQRNQSDDIELFQSAVAMADQVGGDLAYTLENLSRTLRTRNDMHRRIRSLTAMGRMQGRLMTLLPVGIAGVIYLQQPDTMSRLFTHPIGWIGLTVAAVLMVLATVWIRRIVDIEI